MEVIQLQNKQGDHHTEEKVRLHVFLWRDTIKMSVFAGILIALSVVYTVKDLVSNEYEQCRSDASFGVIQWAHHLSMFVITLGWLSNNRIILGWSIYAILYMLMVQRMHQNRYCPISRNQNLRCGIQAEKSFVSLLEHSGWMQQHWLKAVLFFLGISLFKFARVPWEYSNGDVWWIVIFLVATIVTAVDSFTDPDKIEVPQTNP